MKCKKCKLLEDLLKAKDSLLAAYRLSSGKRAGAAIDKINDVEKKLKKLDEDDG